MTTERLTLTTAAGPDISAASALRRLYFVRFGFAIVWALVMFTTAKHLGPLARTLLVVYPAFDVAAAITDARASRTGPAGRRPPRVGFPAGSLLSAVAWWPRRWRPGSRTSDPQ